MSGKRVCLTGVVVVLLGLVVAPRSRIGLASVAHGQAPVYSPPNTPAAPDNLGMVPTGPGGVDGNIGPAGQGMGTIGSESQNQQAPMAVNGTLPMTEWLLYPRSPGCCGPCGRCGPIGGEIYIRSGIVFPGGGGILDHSLQDGWDIDGGARALFFNPERTSAWTLGIGVSNIYNHGRPGDPQVTLTNVKGLITLPSGSQSNPAAETAALQQAGLPPTVVQQIVSQITPASTVSLPVVFPTQNASVAYYNQTFFNLATGHVWYLLGNGDPGQQQCMWRVGWEGGGRYGTSKIGFNEIRHLTDVVGGMFAALYTDLEVPCKCGILQAGFRWEYNYIWGDPLQHENPGDFQSFNLLGTLGIRF